MTGACACPAISGVAPSSLPYIRRTIASLGRPLVAPSTNRSDASCFVSHVLRPSPEGTDIPRLTVFDLEPFSIPWKQVR
jgi:hypothetical protein